jgi:hypothetical protein
MQCKDIPDRPILEFVAVHGGIGCNWFPPILQGTTNERSVQNAMPAGVPGSLVRAKMEMLIRRGLVSGCACGCRGDFEITDKGEEFLRAK